MRRTLERWTLLSVLFTGTFKWWLLAQVHSSLSYIHMRQIIVLYFSIWFSKERGYFLPMSKNIFWNFRTISLLFLFTWVFQVNLLSMWSPSDVATVTCGIGLMIIYNNWMARELSICIREVQKLLSLIFTDHFEHHSSNSFWWFCDTVEAGPFGGVSTLSSPEVRFPSKAIGRTCFGRKSSAYRRK